MKLNLQKDAQQIRRFILQRIVDYPTYVNLGPGDDEDPIKLITFGYYVFQEGYFAMVCDTRHDADSDGIWTLDHNDTNVVFFPEWCRAFESLCDDIPVCFVLPDGSERTLDGTENNEVVTEVFGTMILGVIQEMQRERAFDALPLAPKAFFIIEEFDGTWSWPDYKKRKALGRIRTD